MIFLYVKFYSCLLFIAEISIECTGYQHVRYRMTHLFSCESKTAPMKINDMHEYLYLWNIKNFYYDVYL